MWITPIYDRTQEDVTNKTSKGYINVSDLNRIEGNISYMAELLGVTLTTKTWVPNAWMYKADVRRIGSNINALIGAYGKKPDAPNVPSMPYITYRHWNDIEGAIDGVKRLYDENHAAQIRCGDIYCGEGAVL